MSKKFLIYCGLFVAMATWALSYIAIKEAYRLGMSPVMLVFIRLIIASALLVTYAKMSGKLQPIARKDYKLFILLALFEPFLYYLGESFGLNYVSATTGAIIISTIPVFMPFVIYLFFKERIGIVNIAGVLLSFTGVLLIIMTDQFTLAASPKGLALMFFAVFSAFGYTIIIKKLVGKYNSITIVAIQDIIGSLLFLPVFMAHDAWILDEVVFCWDLVAYVIGLAALATALAYVLFSNGIKMLGATQATIFANLIPVITALFALMLGTEDITVRKFLGIFIVIAGVFISQSKKPFLGIPELLWSYFFKKNQE